MNKETFIKQLQNLNIDISKEQLEKLDLYYKLLIEENKKINLTRITEYEDVYLKHFYDSLTIKKVIDLENQNLCDIGTGAGFPGIVLKIVFPNLNITLVESIQKKCNFLNLVIKNLNLQKIKVVNERAEIYAKEVREQFDIITSRAVANIKELLEYSTPLLKVNGICICMKANIEKEIENIDSTLEKLNLKIIEQKEFNLVIENSKRTLIKLEKTKITDNKYPRDYKQIKKNPL